MLRIFCLLCLLLTLPSWAEGDDNAQSTRYGAGYAKISIADQDGAFDTMIWYPITGAEKTWKAGPFTISATPNADMIQGERFPILLLSHGSGGTPMGHRQLAASLARDGFVVVAPMHLGDAAGRPRMEQQAGILMARPRQAQEALTAILADSRFAGVIDADRLGMIGYSAGGYTALVLAGAHPNFPLASAYCAGEGRNDIGSCRSAVERNETEAFRLLKDWKAPREPRLKALVLLDPLSMLFDQAGLSSVSLPTLLLRPADDTYLNAEHNGLALSRNLPSPPQIIVVPGRHFVFIDPCPESLMAESAPICKDAEGIDRPEIHRRIEADVARFLHQNL